MERRIKVVQGGTWAGKTTGIVALLIDKAAEESGKVITVVSESIPAVKRGPLSNFFDIMISAERYVEDHYNGTERIYTFASGSTMEFTSFDKVGKAHAAGKRTDLFLNEAYYLPFDICDALMSKTSEDIWLDYNPHSLFWVNDELLGRHDVDFIILVPGDNEALPDTIKQDHAIKREKAKTSEYWANWCKVFLDGQPGSSMGAILRNWTLGPFDDSLPWYYGLDFGSKNPDAFIKIAVDRQKSYIYAKEELYQNLLSTGKLGDLLINNIEREVKRHRKTQTDEDLAEVKREARKKLIIADSSAARTIEDLKGRGLNVQPVVKGKVIDDVKMLYDWELIIDPDSVNLQRELNGWVWLDKRGEVPVDEENHLIDALRYIAKTIIKPTVGKRGHRVFRSSR